MVFANAYDCYPAIDGLKQIPADQLHVNYYPYPENYKVIEEFFESHKEYTHILYVAPDVVLERHGWDCLVKYIKDNDPLVYGPCCNVDTAEYEDCLACCLVLPTLEYETRKYKWLKESQRKDAISRGHDIIEVKFNANLAFIRRDIKDSIKYMSIPYETDERPINESRGGYACDLAFCHSLASRDISPLVDLRIKLKHLRYCGELQVGKKPKNLQFFKYKDDKLELCPCQKK